MAAVTRCKAHAWTRGSCAVETPQARSSRAAPCTPCIPVNIHTTLVISDGAKRDGDTHAPSNTRGNGAGLLPVCKGSVGDTASAR
jgi:hypothetical protein